MSARNISELYNVTFSKFAFAEVTPSPILDRSYPELGGVGVKKGCVRLGSFSLQPDIHNLCFFFFDGTFRFYEWACLCYKLLFPLRKYLQSCLGFFPVLLALESRQVQVTCVFWPCDDHVIVMSRTPTRLRNYKNKKKLSLSFKKIYHSVLIKATQLLWGFQQTKTSFIKLSPTSNNNLSYRCLQICILQGLFVCFC